MMSLHHIPHVSRLQRMIVQMIVQMIVRMIVRTPFCNVERISENDWRGRVEGCFCGGIRQSVQEPDESSVFIEEGI